MNFSIVHFVLFLVAGLVSTSRGGVFEEAYEVPSPVPVAEKDDGITSTVGDKEAGGPSHKENSAASVAFAGDESVVPKNVKWSFQMETSVGENPNTDELRSQIEEALVLSANALDSLTVGPVVDISYSSKITTPLDDEEVVNDENEEGNGIKYSALRGAGSGGNTQQHREGPDATSKKTLLTVSGMMVLSESTLSMIGGVEDVDCIDGPRHRFIKWRQIFCRILYHIKGIEKPSQCLISIDSGEHMAVLSYVDHPPIDDTAESPPVEASLASM